MAVNNELTLELNGSEWSAAPFTSSLGEIRLGTPKNPEKMYVPARNGASFIHPLV
jgi:hypothetical protein